MAAGLASKARAHVGWANGINSTDELVELSGASERVVRAWIKDFEEEELGRIRLEERWIGGVTDTALERHRSTVEILVAEVDKLGAAVAEMAVGESGYNSALQNYLRAQRRLSELEGMEALIQANQARAIATAKLEVMKPEPATELPLRPVSRFGNGR